MGLLTGAELWSVAIFFAIFLLLVDLMHRRHRWTARYPPGPMSLPVLGNLLQVDFQNMPAGFQKLRCRFGDLFSLQLAFESVVVLNGLTALREALVRHSEDTADRPLLHTNDHVGFGPRSQGKCRKRQTWQEKRQQKQTATGWTEDPTVVIKTNVVIKWDRSRKEDEALRPKCGLPGVLQAQYGSAWRQQRRFSVSTFRHFGLGKKSLEQWVTEEARCLCAAFTNYNGRPFSPNTLLDKAVCNVIASLLYACRFEYDDPRFIRLLSLLRDTIDEESGFLAMFLNVFPVLLNIPGLPDKVFSGKKAFMALQDELLTEHKMTRDPTQPPRDLIDAFLAEVEKAKGKPESSFNDENLRMVVADLFMAGMVTTSITLSWALLLMILHPDVQSHVQKEIDEVIGQARCPEMADQAHMPYTNAVIHEVQRFGDILPLGAPHKTSRDIELQGFLIPKGTTLITNLSSVLKDETVWEKPLHFHPEHSWMPRAAL
ncbi:hypothetical protein U0070_010768 [Myodes glareolus]|uniref:Uncharacterized protein n=1 Tax=Myodes glareolus TaxID=447135 RepID=A0AAW0H0Z5_MYOGA